MTDFKDMTDAMVKRFREGFDRAAANGVPEPTAMTLATVDAKGRPAARTVLLKDMDERGFVFYTNLGSRKGRHLSEQRDVSLVFWWRENEAQVLVDGKAEPVSDAEADEYFASRPRGSQIGAWASKQSTPMESREEFLARIARFEKKFEGQAVPRPEHWSGFRVRPRRVEFWYGREFRLHERICFDLVDGAWQDSLLYP
ncbi:pyridoxamine 5'-phosphate oxidase [Wenzhouxiangella sp. EGI_FJ10409]|uniref:pyridoxamine 5'-phosphate oxidase n=1 Tax=Wenzhouxiangella sp. EGI_FJ10409 TaxID=3243767 RepID=UPI0035DFC368